MNCLESQRLMRAFLYKKLPPRKLELFLDHIEQCPDCMEELEINHTIKTVLDDDPSGTRSSKAEQAISSSDILQVKIRDARYYLQIRKVTILARRICLLLAQAVIILVMAHELNVLDHGWFQSHALNVNQIMNSGPGRMGADKKPAAESVMVESENETQAKLQEMTQEPLEAVFEQVITERVTETIKDHKTNTAAIQGSSMTEKE